VNENIALKRYTENLEKKAVEDTVLTKNSKMLLEKIRNNFKNGLLKKVLKKISPE
jgi:hypothetical protein